MTIVGSDVAKIKRSEEHKVWYYYILSSIGLNPRLVVVMSAY